MKTIIENGKIILKNQDSFIPEQVFECGQCFRWDREEDGSYTGVAHGKILNVKKSGEDIILDNTNLDDFQNIWINYFDLDTDYSKIKAELSIDETMKSAIRYGDGIRILKQDPFETIISFIISANNRIPQIKKSIGLICALYGESLGVYSGKEYFSFPTPERLSKADVSEIREICRVGFRDERIVNTAKLIFSEEYKIFSYYDLEREDIREKLLELPGVGPKIADCILLFAYGKKDSFPVDVWIKRVMEELYLKEETNKKLIGKAGREKFGEYAGVAQQYLFYYGRENSIGKM